MKKVLFILAFLGFYTLIISANSSDSLNKELPVDENVKVGKLENGLVYYIRENKKPENRVELRLVVNVGSILEDEEQRGLAHFIEHMCFNGTKHFKKNELTDYLQTIGMKFGADINAYTSFDETVYMLTIPSDSAELVDKGFLVLEDWAHNVTFEDEEIDKERGVVIEEWRIGQGPQQRMRDKMIPVIFKDSRYVERIPIGKKEIIENASYETIKSFYHDWYRPDLMAVVVVGDIDSELAEQKIREHFSGITMPEEVRERKYYNIPPHEAILTKVVTDHEAPVTVIRMFYKRDSKTDKTYNDYRELMKNNLFIGMMNRRLYELREKAEPPFIAAGVVFGNLWAPTTDAYQMYALVGENAIDKGLEALITENERIRQYGFSEGELERYKKDVLRNYEIAYNERDKTESDKMASEYVRNYLHQEPIPGITFEYHFAKEYLDGITLNEVNELAQYFIRDRNEVIVVSAPEKEGITLPSDNELLALVQTYKSKEVENYEDKQLGNKLMTDLPEKGEVIKKTRIEAIDAEELLLSNGVKVILKHTDLKNDEILLSAFSLGGYSLYNVDDHFSALHADEIVKEGGLGNYSVSDINKILSGKSVYVAPGISSEMESISGNSTPADFESMLQLLYMYFTEPRVSEEAFQSYITKKKDLYRNLSADPVNYYFDQYNRTKSQNHPRGDYLPKEEDWNKIKYTRSIDIYKDRFADASDFVIIIVGAIDTIHSISLIERYIGSLPSISGSEKYKDMGIRPPEGMVDKRVYKGNDPKSFVNLYFEKETTWNKKDAFLLEILGEVLNMKYIKILREEMSGIYGVRTKSGISQIPYERAWLQIMLPCSPDNVDSLIQATVNEIKTIQTKGLEDDDIIKAREIYKRNFEENLQKNNYWLSAIKKCVLYDIDFSTVDELEFIDFITSGELQRVANLYINTNDYLRVVLYPEEYAAERSGKEAVLN